MCRNIKQLFNFEPPASREEVEASALQYVRKLSGMRQPSQANQEAFDAAVAQVTEATLTLMAALETKAAPKNREAEAQAARARGQKRDARMKARLLETLG